MMAGVSHREKLAFLAAIRVEPGDDTPRFGTIGGLAMRYALFVAVFFCTTFGLFRGVDEVR
jgi:hypothetical protein